MYRGFFSRNVTETTAVISFVRELLFAQPFFPLVCCTRIISNEEAPIIS